MKKRSLASLSSGGRTGGVDRSCSEHGPLQRILPNRDFAGHRPAFSWKGNLLIHHVLRAYIGTDPLKRPYSLKCLSLHAKSPNGRWPAHRGSIVMNGSSGGPHTRGIFLPQGWKMLHRESDVQKIAIRGRIIQAWSSV